MKLITFLLNLICWLSLFLIPFVSIGMMAYYQYSSNPGKIAVIISILSVGGLLGIFAAEFVRRKYGLADFFIRIHASENYERFGK